MIYLVRCDNSMVTDVYLDVIGKMLTDDTQEIADYNKNEKIDKKSIIVVATVIDFVKIYLRGFRRIVFWMQGIESEESYLKHNSKIRKMILDCFTKFSLKEASAILYVSQAMQEFENSKFFISTKSKSFVMPCFNVNLDIKCISTPNKYNRNIFTYVGSLSKWQCFEETVDFYKEIEKIIPDSELHVYTSQKDEAKVILEKKHVNQYQIDFVSSNELTQRLSEVKFGFVLRDDIPVNQVATPTKLSSYLAAGVIPIFSSCLRDFAIRTRNMTYFIPIENKSIIPEKLLRLCENKVDTEKITEEYRDMFLTYYNPEYYVEMYKDTLRELLEKKNVK